MKITLVSREPWNTKDRITGEAISGLSYIGFLPDGTAIKFTSKVEHKVNPGIVGFVENLAEDIPIKTRMFAGKVSYSEAVAVPQQQS